MSRRARALALVALLATMTMATMTAVAQAHTSSDPTTDQSSRQADATVRRLLAREQPTIPSAGPTQAPSPVRPAEHRGQPGWLAPALAALAVVLTLSTGIAVLVARRTRTSRVQRADQTA